MREGFRGYWQLAGSLHVGSTRMRPEKSLELPGTSVEEASPFHERYRFTNDVPHCIGCGKTVLCT